MQQSKNCERMKIARALEWESRIADRGSQVADRVLWVADCIIGIENAEPINFKAGKTKVH